MAALYSHNRETRLAPPEGSTGRLLARPYCALPDHLNPCHQWPSRVNQRRRDRRVSEWGLCHNPEVFEAELVIGVLGVLLAAVGVLVALPAWRQRRETVSRERFVTARELLRAERAGLSAEQFRRAAPQQILADGIPLLGPAGWMPSRPVSLEQVQLRWVHEGPPIEDARQRARKLLPYREGHQRFNSFSDAVVALDAPTSFFNGRSYRLLGVSVDHGVPTLSMSVCDYFDAYDTGEVLGFEAALGESGYRNWLRDPFAFGIRAAVPGVSTLTLRRDGPNLGFIMHYRGARSVGVAEGTYHVAPAGEFQPIDISPVSLRRDFDLWSTICREYAEEFLGCEESAGRSGYEIDWSQEEPYRSLTSSRAAGELSVWFLGVGLDPLTWKPEILTACVIDAPVFDSVFADLVRKNLEGTMVSLAPFDDVTISTYLDDGRTLAAGKACLALARQHRDLLTALGGSPSSA